MHKVLIVDDNPMDQRLAGACVQQCGMDVVYAANGQEALDALRHEAPDIILTDLDMPEINGLELVRRLQSRAPAIPVILMTSKGSEEIAAEALKAGASSYVPKRNLQSELETSLRIVRDAASTRDRRQSVYNFLESSQLQFVIGNDVEAAAALVSHWQDALVSMNLCTQAQLLTVGTALLEALSLAIERGNLELDPTSRSENNGTDHATLRQRRLAEAPYSNRKVFVTSTLTKADAAFTIRNEGPGFDLSTIPDPDDAETLMHDSDRAMLLIQMFMDDVSFNEQGNEMTLRLYAEEPESEA